MSLDQFIADVKKIEGQRPALTHVYDFLSQKYFGDRIRRFTYLTYLWQERDLNRMWANGGPTHCMNINRLLKHILVNSGHFTPEQVILKWTIVHQYVIVHFDDNTSTYVDVRGKHNGTPLGTYYNIRDSKEK